MKALVNPFEVGEGLPCIPDAIALPSLKYSALARGSFDIGTQGVGFVTVSPFCPANDTASVKHTTNLYTGTTFNIGPPNPTGVNDAFHDAPYTTSQLNASVFAGREYRVVGCGLKANYIGSEFQRAGMEVLHRQPSNQGIINGSTATSLFKYRTTQAATMARSTHDVFYRPDTPQQLGYAPWKPTDVLFPMTIFISGGTPGQSLYWEAVWYFELIGDLGQPSVSHADPVGLAAVLGAVPSVESTKTPQQQLVLTARKAAENVAMSESGMVTVTNAGRAILKDLIPNALAGLGGYVGGPIGSFIGKGLGSLFVAGDKGVRDFTTSQKSITNGPLVEEID
jgi:hypothetical protein